MSRSQTENPQRECHAISCLGRRFGKTFENSLKSGKGKTKLKVQYHRRRVMASFTEKNKYGLFTNRHLDSNGGGMPMTTEDLAAPASAHKDPKHQLTGGSGGGCLRAHQPLVCSCLELLPQGLVGRCP